MAGLISRVASAAVSEATPLAPAASPPKGALLGEIGFMRLFGTADIDRQGLQEGWSPSEDGHNWNDGPDARLLIWIASAPAEPFALIVEGSPYLPEGVACQNATLYVNGHRLAFWPMTAQRSYHLKAIIEPEHWLARHGGSLLNGVWHLPNSVRPADIGAAQDERQLGFCFRTLVIEPL